MTENGPQLLISDNKGKIRSAAYLEPAGMKAGLFFKLTPRDLIELPPSSKLFMLPQRSPVGYDPAKKRFVTLKGPVFAVCAFIEPGFTTTYNAAYAEIGRPKMLPLFSYAVAILYKEKYYAASVRVDKDKRHDPRFIDIDKVKAGISKFRKVFPANRLIRHLEGCALKYFCPNAQNLFLQRCEAPLPVSRVCNARCAGCISHQENKKCPAAQPRIKFVPSPEEIAETALFHIANVRDPIVSFGQGCEGEPLLAAEIIEKAIRLIRKNTGEGTININTNASRPKAIVGLLDAGLDTMRVSLNSVRREYYDRYYRPRGYSFKDVLRSIRIAKKKGRWVSLNYLTMPGFTDSKNEHEALKKFIAKNHPDMIQWRNLNFDPLEYFRILKISVPRADMLGVKGIMRGLTKTFPSLRMGYFNPAVSKG